MNYWITDRTATSEDRGLHSRSATCYATSLFLLILLARVVYVSLFGVETPFWDQWDAEAAYLLKPWQDGTWTLEQLFSSHNEHRIVFTRLMSLFVFYVNGGQWNNLVSAYANCILASAYITTLFIILCRNASRTAKVSSFIAATAAGVLPFSWENFLVGFQSQFYFMALLAIVTAEMTAFHAVTVRRAFVIWMIATCALFTCAGGLIGAGCVLAIVCARAWQEQTLSRPTILLSMLMITVIAAGVMFTPDVPSHAALRAQGLVGHMHALTTAIMWPVEQLPGHHFRSPFKVIVVLVLWAPAIAWAIRIISHKDASATVIFALSMAAWVAVQTVAIAHSRGNGMDMVPSRYSDIPAIGLVVNMWLAFEFAAVHRFAIGRGRMFMAMPSAFVVVVLFGFVSRHHEDMTQLAERSYLLGRETANVAAYKQTDDASWLDQPMLEIPYPDARRLKTLLDDRTVITMLPPSIQGAGGRGAEPLSAAAAYIQHAVKKAVASAIPRIQSIEPDTLPQRRKSTPGN